MWLESHRARVCAPRGGVGRAQKEQHSPPAPSVTRGSPRADSLPGTRLCVSSEKINPSLAPKACLQKARPGQAVHLPLPVGASLPRYKDLKMVPSFSLPLSFSVSQMAILLTAAKKALHSTGHTNPGMFVELFELQPFPPAPPSPKTCFF